MLSIWTDLKICQWVKSEAPSKIPSTFYLMVPIKVHNNISYHFNKTRQKCSKNIVGLGDNVS